MVRGDIDETLSLVEDVRERAQPRPQLYVVFDAARPLAPTSRHSLEAIDEVTIGRGTAASATRRDRVLDLRRIDRWMSSVHVRLRRNGAGFQIEDGGSKNGTLVNGTRTSEALLQDGDVIGVGQTLLLFRDRVPTSVRAPLDVDTSELQPRVAALATLSPELGVMFDALIAVGSSAVPVLVYGETGTGKEGIARAVHALSHRKGPCVAVNCGALPTALVASELFGYRAGAFSGATEDRPGLARSADGGTLFLDEIGDLPEVAQTALLRVLQEREVLPLGATRAIPIDLRVVAATHRDLAAAVAKGTFRADLFARLRGFTARLPPLRERREDFGLIVAAVLRRHAPDEGEHVTFTSTAARALIEHPWPHNIRELERRLVTAVALARGTPIERDQLFEEPDEIPAEPAAADGADAGDRDALVAALLATGGNIVQTARRLGTHPRQVYRWIDRHAISLAELRTRR
ncbi:MAG: sigma 54-dependent Fis family transcriptional regulator [Deltaproteobacteria bacterium]|nr:sigma 54-dependent Fis family transcriptional regulator [Deltaproteobacteria bacterium]